MGGAKVVILTHFGRPEGKVVNELSVWPVAECIGKLLGQRIKFETDVVGAGGITAAQTLQSGQILMMENLRFYPEEEANDYIFAKKLASLGDLYVGDAFSCAHRAHASIDLLPRLLPAAVGKSFASELRALGSVLTNPQRPLIAVVGGSNIEQINVTWWSCKMLMALFSGVVWQIHFCLQRVFQLANHYVNLIWLKLRRKL